MTRHSLSLASLASLATLAVPALAAGGKLNVYWGQSGFRTLSQVCQEDALDFVTLSFINETPENDGNTNYPGMEFAAHCPGTTYTVHGEASNLISGCTDIQEGIPVCQQHGTKVILSIGGVFDAQLANYNLTTEDNGRYFADFLWGAFGPYNASWSGPRPFDLSATQHNSVDGFDFDIEKEFPSEDPWIALIDQLRSHWTGGEYLITGAPQCPIVSDATLPMKKMIAASQFDLIWVQFYNNPECDGTTSAFNFDEWVTFLQGTRSAHAQLYIGLPADQGASGYLDEPTLTSLLNKYGTSPSFGGVMLWDENLSYTNNNASSTNETYADLVKQIMAGVPPPPPSSTSSVSVTASPTASSTPCSNPYIVQATDDCYDLAVTYGTTVTQILALNPQLDRFCDLTSGQAICLPQACTRYYTVQSGDSCYKIDTTFGISLTQFQQWNPTVNTDCTNLNIGQKVCVSVTPGNSTGNWTSSSIPSSVSVTSSPTASASPSTVPCGKHYTVVAGDSCYVVDTKYGLTFSQLQALNPGAINSDCTNLDIGQVLCVAGLNSTSSSSIPSIVPSTTVPTTSATASSSSVPCGKHYTVAAGDSCYKVDTLYNLTFSQLQSLNPSAAINTDCTNLQIGQVLCVAGVKSNSSSSVSPSKSSLSTSTSLSTGHGTAPSSGFSTVVTSSQSYMWANTTTVTKTVSKV
ncbi:Chitinase 2 [Sporothrix stenoceras]|uniref:Chitinase 2 n=1 Tax=Sporothrix stenoceras TaxID=5173 RepID=A0ABR3Z5F4_9PEZI